MMAQPLYHSCRLRGLNKTIQRFLLCRFWHAIQLAVVSGLLVPSLGWAADIEGVTFSDTYRAGTLTLPLHGIGLAKYHRIIKVFVAALYLGPTVQSDAVLTDVPKRLELSYFHSVKAVQFGEGAIDILADTFPATMLAALTPRLDAMHRLYEDVKPGDRYALTYLPGVGTELALNGQLKGVIQGADFAQAYFAIWLGPNPFSQSLKDALLHRQ